MTLSPIITSSRLAEHKIVRPKDLTIRPDSDTIHGPGLKIHDHDTREKPSTRSLVDALQLHIRVPRVTSGGIDVVLVANHIPELGSDLLLALPALHVKDFPQFSFESLKSLRN
ncbi:hypothetical protein V6N13_113787 [Hibiscus sabdariffa]|uniref:Uncharacterized protein n=1 Tax=Hibiscus sabdariffa TaxID=183260 RepID=A0ABR2U0N3_9ROSI